MPLIEYEEKSELVQGFPGNPSSPDGIQLIAENGNTVNEQKFKFRASKVQAEKETNKKIEECLITKEHEAEHKEEKSVQFLECSRIWHVIITMEFSTVRLATFELQLEFRILVRCVENYTRLMNVPTSRL